MNAKGIMEMLTHTIKISCRKYIETRYKIDPLNTHGGKTVHFPDLIPAPK